MADNNSIGRQLTQQELPFSTTKRKGGNSTKQPPADAQARMVSNYLSGDSYEAAGAKEGYSSHACVRAVRRANVAPRKVFFSNEELSVMAELCKGGLSLSETGRRFNCDHHVVTRACRLFNVSYEKHAKPFVWTEESLRILRERYPKIGLYATAELLGVKPYTVTKKAVKLGVHSEVRHELMGKTNAANNRSVDIHFFETWTPNMAYILGYVWADGCLVVPDDSGHCLRLLCTKTDEQFLLDIRSEMKSNHKMRPHKAIDNWLADEFGNKWRIRSKEAVAISINSKHLVATLQDIHGLAPRKSSKDLPFGNVPEEFLCHFARGHFDGDGSISRRQTRQGASASFLGTPRWLSEFNRRICSAVDLRDKGLYGRNKLLRRISWERKDELARLFAWLYPFGDYICLQRKRDKFQAIVDFQSKNVRGWPTNRLKLA